MRNRGIILAVAMLIGFACHAQRTFVAASSQWAQGAWTDSGTQTWSVWLQIAATNATLPAVGTTRGWVGDNHYRLLFYSSGLLLFSERDGGSPRSSISNTLPVINSWMHLGARFIGATNRILWVNGTACAVDTNLVSPTSLDEVYIGRIRTSTSPYHFGGKIAEPAIWNAALTDAEISQLASGGVFTKRTHPYRIRPNDLMWCPDLTIPGAAVPGVGGITQISNSPAYTPVLPAPFK